MTNRKIKINRAPVLTLWATVVARRMGYEEETALTLGKAVAGLNAQSKGRKLGIYEEKSEEEKQKERKKKEPAKTKFIEILGRGVPAVKTPKGLRAAIDGDPIDAESVDTYLKQKFKDDYKDARSAMENWQRLIHQSSWKAKPTAYMKSSAPKSRKERRAGEQGGSWIWTTSAPWLNKSSKLRICKCRPVTV